MLNAEALREAVEYVEAQAELPEAERTWDQSVYRAEIMDWSKPDAEPRMVGCLASHLAEEAGGQWYGRGLMGYLLAEDGDNDNDLFDHRDDPRIPHGTKVIHVADRARRVLGVDAYWAAQLFVPYVQAEDIRQIVDDILAAYSADAV